MGVSRYIRIVGAVPIPLPPLFPQCPISQLSTRPALFKAFLPQYPLTPPRSSPALASFIIFFIPPTRSSSSLIPPPSIAYLRSFPFLLRTVYAPAPISAPFLSTSSYLPDQSALKIYLRNHFRLPRVRGRGREILDGRRARAARKSPFLFRVIFSPLFRVRD